MRRALGAGSFVAALMLVACNVGGNDGAGPKGGKLDPSALSETLGLTLPAGARVLGASESHGLDEAFFAKVSFAAEDWRSFLSTSPVAEGDFEEDKRYLLGPDSDWWDPGRASSLPTAQAQLPDGKVLNVGVDRSDPARFVLYLMCHGT